MNLRQLGCGIMVLALTSSFALGQGPGGRRGPGGPGGPGGGFGRGGGMGVSRLSLLGIEAVQKEIDLVEEQLASVQELTEKLRNEGRGEGRGDRPNFQEMTDEERQQWQAERQKRAAEQAAKAKQELQTILLEDQLARLEQIYIQVAGTQALSDPDVAAALAITDEQKAKIETVRDEANGEMREKMREIFEANSGDGDRDANRAKMTELRKAADEKVLAALNADQLEKLTAMKGEAFEMPADALFGGRGGPGGFGGGGRGGRGEGRPQRPNN